MLLVDDNAASLLELRDADALSGADFWSVFTARDAAVAAGPARHVRGHLQAAVGFSLGVRAFTATGRKLWLTASFEAATRSPVRPC